MISPNTTVTEIALSIWPSGLNPIYVGSSALVILLLCASPRLVTVATVSCGAIVASVAVALAQAANSCYAVA